MKTLVKRYVVFQIWRLDERPIAAVMIELFTFTVRFILNVCLSEFGDTTEVV